MRYFSILFSLLLCFVFMGCDYYTEANRKAAETENRRISNSRYKAVQDISFIKHEETGLCFAYMWGGAANGGPALANVPCEDVEDFLIEYEE